MSQKKSRINSDHTVQIGPFTIDTECKRLDVNGEVHNLPPKLFGLLMLLIENSGKIVYRENIMKTVWHTDYMGDTRTLDVHIRWLREKLEENPSAPKHLLTVRGSGYRFIENPDA